MIIKNGYTLDVEVDDNYVLRFRPSLLNFRPSAIRNIIVLHKGNILFILSGNGFPENDLLYNAIILTSIEQGKVARLYRKALTIVGKKHSYGHLEYARKIADMGRYLIPMLSEGSVKVL